MHCAISGRTTRHSHTVITPSTRLRPEDQIALPALIFSDEILNFRRQLARTLTWNRGRKTRCRKATESLPWIRWPRRRPRPPTSRRARPTTSPASTGSTTSVYSVPSPRHPPHRCLLVLHRGAPNQIS